MSRMGFSCSFICVIRVISGQDFLFSFSVKSVPSVDSFPFGLAAFCYHVEHSPQTWQGGPPL